MKTAMQMVLDDLIHSINHNGSISYEYLKQKLEKALETEKKQIIDFANKCQLVREVDCDENVIFSFKPEDLFESTFNTTNKKTLK